MGAEIFLISVSLFFCLSASLYNIHVATIVFSIHQRAASLWFPSHTCWPDVSSRGWKGREQTFENTVALVGGCSLGVSFPLAPPPPHLTYINVRDIPYFYITQRPFSQCQIPRGSPFRTTQQAMAPSHRLVPKAIPITSWSASPVLGSVQSKEKASR